MKRLLLKRALGLPVVIAATLAALALVLHRWRTAGFSGSEFIGSLRHVDWNWLALAFILILGTYIGRALRWEVMLRPLAKNVNFLRVLGATCIGFTAVVLFGRAGEPVRPFLIARNEGVSFSSQVAAWVVERIMDILMILIIFGVALTQVSHTAIQSSARIATILRACGAAAGLTGALCLILLAALRQFRGGVQQRLLDALSFLPASAQARCATFLSSFEAGMESTRSSSFTLLLVTYSLLEWLVIVGCFYCVFRAFPATAGLGFTDIVIVLGFVSFGSVVQIPGIGGGMQIVTVLVLTEFYGVGLEAASSVALILWLISFFLIVPIGLVLAFREGLKWHNLSNIGSGTP